MGKSMDGPWKIYFEQGKSYDDAIKLITELSELSSKCVWYYHPNGKEGKGPHFHGLVFGYPKTDETCRNTIKKTLNLEGAGTFAVSDKLPKKMGGKKMTELLTPTYITYMSKGIFDPVYVSSYENSYIELLKTYWIDNEVKNPNIQNIFVEETKKKAITQWDMAQQVHTQILADNPDIEHGDNIRVNVIIRKAIRILKENKKLAHKRAVTNLVQDVMADLNPELYIQQIERMI